MKNKLFINKIPNLGSDLGIICTLLGESAKFQITLVSENSRALVTLRQFRHELVPRLAALVVVTVGWVSGGDCFDEGAVGRHGLHAPLDCEQAC